jgi:hypothetical protein
LTGTDTAAINQGYDGTAEFLDDIDYQTRTGLWDIGADEYMGAGPTQLTSPTLSSPADTAIGVSTSTSLSWSDTNSSPNETNYRVCIGTSNTSPPANCANAAADATSMAASTALGGALSNSTTYYWTVYALGDGSTTSDSTIPTNRSFTTAAAGAPVAGGGGGRLRLR